MYFLKSKLIAYSAWIWIVRISIGVIPPSHQILTLKKLTYVDRVHTIGDYGHADMYTQFRVGVRCR